MEKMDFARFFNSATETSPPICEARIIFMNVLLKGAGKGLLSLEPKKID